MSVLVTGGAGFIGRWVVKSLLEQGQEVYVLDNLTNGSLDNLDEFRDNPKFKEPVIGDIINRAIVKDLFGEGFDTCLHLAASIHVHKSVDDPYTTFMNDVLGTFHILEACRKHGTRLVYMSTCHVYDQAAPNQSIGEDHPAKPVSPYAGSKLAGEKMVLSYHYAYGLPAVILRPFNTYGPFQKGGPEGGVVSIFLQNKIAGRPLIIHGDGSQTRDLLYVEDCAGFIVEVINHREINGEIINAGTGRDISVRDLARLIAGNEGEVCHIPHVGPRSEVPKFLCNYQKAWRLLGWNPEITIKDGLARTENWFMGVTGR
ncbi:MAG: GDP-mannose 4,6-dehydratase [Clostridia bacterium]|nr:GDP-mannose 4,6-dehydratase [Clostridia bacterium]